MEDPITNEELLSLIQENKTLINDSDKIFLENVGSLHFAIWVKLPPSKWAVYEFYRHVDTSINVDVWRLGSAYTCDKLFDRTNQIMLTAYNSQWEYATVPQGAPDAFGGYHGDEKIQSILFLIDGRQNFLSQVYGKSITRLEIVQHTICYNPIDGTTKLGDMYSRHIFTKNGIQLKWKMVWSGTATIVSAFGGMLPALRGSTTTTKGRLLEFPTVYDVSASSHSNPSADTFGADLWNDSNNVALGVEFDDLSFFNGFINTSGAGVQISNNPSYNKIYPKRINSSSEIVNAGDTWRLSANYRIYNRNN
jgi:hypothetical protein